MPVMIYPKTIRNKPTMQNIIAIENSLLGFILVEINPPIIENRTTNNSFKNKYEATTINTSDIEAYVCINLDKVTTVIPIVNDNINTNKFIVLG